MLKTNPALKIPRPPLHCENGNCGALATTMIGFPCKPHGSAAMCCDKHMTELVDQYRRLGSPGQIVLMPASSPGAAAFWCDANPQE